MAKWSNYLLLIIIKAIIIIIIVIIITPLYHTHNHHITPYHTIHTQRAFFQGVGTGDPRYRESIAWRVGRNSRRRTVEGRKLSWTRSNTGRWCQWLWWWCVIFMSLFLPPTQPFLFLSFSLSTSSPLLHTSLLTSSPHPFLTLISPLSPSPHPIAPYSRSLGRDYWNWKWATADTDCSEERSITGLSENSR